tara:strand:+ start:208 stop:444 length:237 start_codon:yes stop_codon:yes gene_type:complete
MTKKDFIKIANILKTTELEPHKRASLAVSFAAVCRDDNPNFNVDRFLKACGELTSPEPAAAESSTFDLDRDLEDKMGA